MDSNKTFSIMVAFAVIFIVYIWIIKPKNEEKVVSPDDEQKKEMRDSGYIENSETLLDDIRKSNFQIVRTSQEKEYDLIYENKNIKVEFDPHDARIKHAWVKDTFLNREELKLYDLVSPRTEDEGALILKFGSWENENTLANLTEGNNLYHYERNDDIFTFKCQLKKKNEDLVYTIIKRYEFVEDTNVFKFSVEIFNNKNRPAVFDNSGIAYSIGWGPLLGLDSRSKRIDKRKVNSFTFFDGKDLVKITEKSKILGKDKKFATAFREGNSSWIASNGHYFAALMYPDDQNYKYFFDYREKEKKNFYCGLSRYTNKSRIDSTFYIYIGPKIKSVLKEADEDMKEKFNIEDANISKLNERIMFYIGNVIGDLLEFIYKYVKNYGLAIILLTIIIKLLLSPLTHKSMISQQKMSALQPKLKEIQERYKDKPEMLNKETMQLYKKEGISPLSGCLPIMLQMPILIAMYSLLTRMVALKGASFLWIKDLSSPDSVLNFSFTIPVVNIDSLNILPIVMAGVQALSSILMPDVQSNKQAKMMMWMMPLLFFFLFYNAASGLVLYWTVMNVLNLGQQFYINYMKKKVENK